MTDATGLTAAQDEIALDSMVRVERMASLSPTPAVTTLARPDMRQHLVATAGSTFMTVAENRPNTVVRLTVVACLSERKTLRRSSDAGEALLRADRLTGRR